MAKIICILVALAALTPQAGAAAPTEAKDPYRERREQFRGANPAARRVPVIPPRGQKLRVIIDADAHNEIDDVWAIALALLSPERFQIEGFVAANYDNGNEGAGPRSLATSAATIHTLLAKTGMTGKIPVKLGSAPMRYQFEASESEGVDFIIERAMASTPEDPLWIIGLGAATDLASAYLKEPRIADRVVIFWHGRTDWPHKANNFNVHGDVRAARILFHSNLSFVLFDTGSRLYCPMEESAAWVQTSELGRYLHEFRLKSPWYQSPTKGFYDLGDIAALVDPSLATWETVAGPEVAWDLTYQFRGTMGKILRAADIDRDGTFALFGGRLAGAAKTGTVAPTPQRVLADLERAADWQLAHPTARDARDWVYAAFYTGLLALSEISTSERFEQAVMKVGEEKGWTLGPDPYNADDQAVAQAYADRFLKYRRPEMIAPTQQSFQFVLGHSKELWYWCDALFMGPPGWARLSQATGDPVYLNYALQFWKTTTDQLYDPAEKLYYRDQSFIGKTGEGGRKIFWSRGNGWVMAGLARLLAVLPREHAARAGLEVQFREMAARILALQQADGLWRASLLDPEGYPSKETSGSAFFCFAFAWGVNQGLLPKEQFAPAIWRAWTALAAAIESDGRLTYVQPIGAAPDHVPREASAPYGTGALLLAGGEVYRLAGGEGPVKTVSGRP